MDRASGADVIAHRPPHCSLERLAGFAVFFGKRRFEEHAAITRISRLYGTDEVFQNRRLFGKPRNGHFADCGAKPEGRHCQIAVLAASSRGPKYPLPSIHTLRTNHICGKTELSYCI